MTRAERQEKIEETRNAKYHEQGGRCFHCGKPVRYGYFQLAHVIPKRDWCYKHFGAEVIDHPSNMHGTCSLYCNGRVQINPDSQEAERFAESIREALHGAIEVW